MKYVIAMYRAGFQVAAEDCDYKSAKDLGLICPFCKEAVFLRKGSCYKRGESTVSTPVSFAHYPNSELIAQDCELRAKRKEGEDYLRHLENESRNQRLKLFNEHLWTMFANQIGVSKRDILAERKYFGKKRLSKFCRVLSASWSERETKDLNYAAVLKTTESFNKRLPGSALRVDSSHKEGNQIYADWTSDEDIKKKVTQTLGPQIVYGGSGWGSFSEAMEVAKNFDVEKEREAIKKERARVQRDWAAGVDKQLHLAICKEICGFLGTRTAGHAFEKLCIVSLRDVREKLTSVDLLPKSLEHPEVFIEPILWWMSFYVSHVRWLEEIRSQWDWQTMLD